MRLGGETGIYVSRFGCGSSRSMAMVIPQTNLKRGLPGATAQRWRANRGLGYPGSTTGRSLALSGSPESYGVPSAADHAVLTEVEG